MVAGITGLIINWFLFLFLMLGVFDRFLEQQGIRKGILGWILLFLLIGGNRVVDLPMLRNFSVLFAVLQIMAVYLWLKQSEKSRMHLVSAGFLIGTCLFFLQLVLRLDPVLMIFEESYMIASLAALLTVIAAKGPTQQFIIIVFGLSLNEVGFQYYIYGKSAQFFFGSPSFLDLCWITFSMLIIVRGLFSYGKWITVFRRKKAETSG
ncbi:YphA family membrane protein [Ammoniphilus resinae]|uniref:Uncharacterized protein n=1 Tax=Ammoniphilus resinae TaxID=861532 RepID=A0ABS4GT98_9BACL|nr:hypothetical protein [Ammoniphilus resinae]MBP1933471.1 hypothetical protein [Ammoniphilus resinae]